MNLYEELAKRQAYNINTAMYDLMAKRHLKNQENIMKYYCFKFFNLNYGGQNIINSRKVMHTFTCIEKNFPILL